MVVGVVDVAGDLYLLPVLVRIPLGQVPFSGVDAQLGDSDGVGGGFVIVPALRRYTDLEIRSIQATSLAVIALVSTSGVTAAAAHGPVLWSVALPFAAGAVTALLAGQQLARRLDARRLQQAFAWFCLLVAMLMLARAFAWLANG